MHAKFLAISEEKQERILNAAMKEFAHKGYELASTNTIIKNAGISKGLLFHYFSNKKQLFLFLYDYYVELTLKEMYEKIDYSIRDIIARIQQMAGIKFQLLERHPDMFRFFETAYLETSEEVAGELAQRNKAMMETQTTQVFDGVDYSLFKPEVDPAKTVNIILWTLEGYGKSRLEAERLQGNENIDYEKMFADAAEYIHLLKQLLYR